MEHSGARLQPMEKKSHFAADPGLAVGCFEVRSCQQQPDQLGRPLLGRMGVSRHPAGTHRQGRARATQQGGGGSDLGVPPSPPRVPQGGRGERRIQSGRSAGPAAPLPGPAARR